MRRFRAWFKATADGRQAGFGIHLFPFSLNVTFDTLRRDRWWYKRAPWSAEQIYERMAADANRTIPSLRTDEDSLFYEAAWPVAVSLALVWKAALD